jgi:hypothetical protein
MDRSSGKPEIGQAGRHTPSFETPTQVGRTDLGELLRTRQSVTAIFL